MLSSETKRRIDSCRDILVGQLPLPTDQVELITLALIYKFMDDLDEQSVQLGGKRSFFIKDLADFRWRSLMPQTVSAADRVRLFADGLEALGDPKTGKHLPEMFRDIFRNAMLKFRDGRILSLFLTELDGFAYSHSEELGNAFEYLLQSMGAQGENGQFRTPRHIIDFIVEVLEPKPEDKILDPACGTGGFLVSAYKHILGKHTSKGSSVPGDELSPAKKEKLTQQLNGYDITPMMVKLSKVNMFLHGFSDPQIHEYDTLSNDARWNEKYDLIMANPPFMTPKGGVVPHTKFRIAAKKAEVLFTDYIAEHLTTNGRAGIIVPEGIIFQGGTAYKALRKFLVEDSLVAVISLPSGVFSPYSLVKTSILILDKDLSRQSESIAFFKVENDGFDLGAQRRPIDKNDLPRLTQEIHEYLGKVRSGKKVEEEDNLHLVPKARIAASGEYNFSAERYREGKNRNAVHAKVPMETIAEVRMGETLIKGNLTGKGKPIFSADSSNEVWAYSDPTKLSFGKNTVVIGARGTIGSVKFPRLDCFTCTQTTIAITANENQILPEFLYYWLKEYDFNQITEGVGIPMITVANVNRIEIPLPPLETQKEIVAEIDGYQKVINGARAVVENYKPQIPIDLKAPIKMLGEVCDEILTGPFGSSLHESDYIENGIPIVNPKNIVNGKIFADPTKTVSNETRSRLKEFELRAGDVAIGRRGEMGRCAIVSDEMSGWLCGTGCFVLRLKKSCDARYITALLSSPTIKTYLEKVAVGGTLKNLNQDILGQVKLPVPAYDVQLSLVEEIKNEETIIDANKELIVRFEKKIQAVMDRLWGNGTAE